MFCTARKVTKACGRLKHRAVSSPDLTGVIKVTFGYIECGFLQICSTDLVDEPI